VVAPAGEVLVEQCFERVAVEPIGNRVCGRQQDIAAPLAEEGADQGANRHRKAVLLAVDDRRRQVAAAATRSAGSCIPRRSAKP